MTFLVGLLLIALSAGLVWSHFETRRIAVDPRQFRRRMLTSGLMGLLGLSLVVGQFIVAAAQPILFILFWLAVLAMAALLGLSGLIDLWATRHAIRRRRRTAIAEVNRLNAELAQAKALQRTHGHQTNGRNVHAEDPR